VKRGTTRLATQTKTAVKPAAGSPVRAIVKAVGQVKARKNAASQNDRQDSSTMQVRKKISREIKNFRKLVAP
jgi:hypothetical protein